MRKRLRPILWALGVLAFFLLAPALVEKPVKNAPPLEERPFAALFFSTVSVPDQQSGDRSAPLRIDRPEGPALAVSQPVGLPDLKADANGHPLDAKTYIEAVYQAFRLEDKSG